MTRSSFNKPTASIIPSPICCDRSQDSQIKHHLPERTLSDGLLTILAQFDPASANIDEAGWVGEGHYRRLVSSDGHHTLFHQALKSTLPRYAQRSKKVRWPGIGINFELLALERLVTVAHDEGVEVILFTYLYHAWMLTGLHNLGLFPALADWKMMLASWAAMRSIPLWDFTHFSIVAEEAVSAPGDRRTTMRWYWEGGHFKASLGAAMVLRMLGNPADRELVAVRLTPVEAALAESGLTIGHATFRIADPHAVAVIATMINEIAATTHAAERR